MALVNNLKVIRTSEGLTITDLAGLAGVSTKTISRLEEGKRSVAPTMKHRIVKALNKAPSRTKEYTFKDVFLKDPEW
jgi:transcriptional regulator with XRE-family HTH domain